MPILSRVFGKEKPFQARVSSEASGRRNRFSNHSFCSQMWNVCCYFYRHTLAVGSSKLRTRLVAMLGTGGRGRWEVNLSPPLAKRGMWWIPGRKKCSKENREKSGREKRGSDRKKGKEVGCSKSEQVVCKIDDIREEWASEVRENHVQSLVSAWQRKQPVQEAITHPLLPLARRGPHQWRGLCITNSHSSFLPCSWGCRGMQGSGYPQIHPMPMHTDKQKAVGAHRIWRPAWSPPKPASCPVGMRRAQSTFNVTGTGVLLSTVWASP